MATEACAGGRSATTTRRAHRVATRSGDGPDQLTVALLSLAAFLIVLALLAGQLSASVAQPRAHRVVLVRTVYRTRVIETVAGSGSGQTSVSRSVTGSVAGASAAASAPATSAPTTRTS